MEAIGGGWPSVEGSHTGATVALKLSVFWLNPLALTPEPGSALFSAALLTCTLDHRELWKGRVNQLFEFTGL